MLRDFCLEIRYEVVSLMSRSQLHPRCNGNPTKWSYRLIGRLVFGFIHPTENNDQPPIKCLRSKHKHFTQNKKSLKKQILLVCSFETSNVSNEINPRSQVKPKPSRRAILLWLFLRPAAPRACPFRGLYHGPSGRVGAA